MPRGLLDAKTVYKKLDTLQQIENPFRHCLPGWKAADREGIQK